MGKEALKLSLFADAMIVYIKKKNCLQQKLLDLIGDFFWQKSRTQSQYSEIDGIFVYQQ